MAPARQDRTRRVGFIGRGRLAAGVARAIADGGVPGWEVGAALARDGRERAFPGPVLTDRAAFFGSGLDLIIEAGGPQALVEFGPAALAAADLWTISASALADPAFYERMERIGAETGHRLRLVAGAFGGMDAVAALATLPGTTVTFAATWTGDDASKPAVRETASAREIVSRHRGVNALAAAAIAGVGLDATRIDYAGEGPGGLRVLAVEATGPGGTYAGRSTPTVDPQAGAQMVVGSLVAALRNETRVIWCG